MLSLSKNMNKKKLYIIDYTGFSSIKNEPLGHSQKVTKELSVMFSENGIDTSVIIPENYRTFFDDINIQKIYLTYHMIDSRGGFYKFSNAFKRILNIISVFRKTAAHSILYFVISDIYLYFFIWLYPKKIFPRFIILNKYSNNVETFKQHCFNAFLAKIDHKIDLRIASNEKLLNSGKNKSMLIPDYFYNEKYYSRYIPAKKNEEIICLGVMREHDKDLEKLVKAFSGIKYKLKIIGYFTETNLYEKLLELAKSNSLITIENRLLNDDEYYKYLGGAKYSIMPYKINMYRQRTSGVLLESVFMDTIPICHKSLLDFNNVAGISYERLEDLKQMDFANMANPEILKANNELKARYNHVSVVDKFMKKIN